jgi:hypothetical protein
MSNGTDTAYALADLLIVRGTRSAWCSTDPREVRKGSKKTKKGYRRKACNPSMILVRQEGLEPPTLGLEGRCSIQLSYCRMDRYLHETSTRGERPDFPQTEILTDLQPTGPGL